MATTFVPGRLEDPLSLNDSNVAWWNCGGFAMGRHEWYTPDCVQSSMYMVGEITVDDALEMMVSEILDRFPHLRRVSTCRLPAAKTIVGLRLASSSHPTHRLYDDLHFIVRIQGVWWEKMGNRPITPFLQSPTGTWVYPGVRSYDLPIAWFVDDRD